MKNIKNKMQFRKRYVIIIVILTLLLAPIMFFQFTSLGYRMSVPYRSFTQRTDHVYVANDYSGSIDELDSIVDQATKRVNDFWEGTKSNPVIIICDNPKTLKKLGGDHDTATVVFLKAYSYISLSSEYLNVDVLAHEMTHAELHSRLYEGKLPQSLVPAWFDEGVATQNDYRTKYNDEAWQEATQNGLTITDFSSIDTYPKFNKGESADRVYRYIISRHEVKEWIERNGVDGLIELISSVNKGENFDELYNSR